MSRDDGTNPDAETWVDPDLAKNPMAEDQPTEVVKDPAREHIEMRVAQMKADGILPSEDNPETAQSEDQDENAGTEVKAAPKKAKKARKAKQAGDTATGDQEKSFSESFLLLMEKEKELQAKREEISTIEAKARAYEQAAAKAAVDPLAVLKAAGWEPTAENLEALARLSYNESLGDLAPEDYKSSKEVQELKYTVKQLQEQQEAKAKAAEEAKAQAEARVFLEQYNGQLAEQIETVDAEIAPVTAAFLSNENFGTEGVLNDMWTVTDAMYKETGNVPTPSEVATRLESEYNKRYGHFVQPRAEQANPERTQADNKTRPQSRMVRNRNATVQTVSDSLDEYAEANGDLEAYNKMVKKVRARAEAKWREKGLTR